MMKMNHPFHLVELSPWPILSSFMVMSTMMGSISSFHLNKHNLMMMSMILLMLIMYQWWRDITRESTFQGLHTNKVFNGMKWGMILFITSEVMFFISFFWSFFHSSLSPNIELNMMWPPMGVTPFNPMEIPLLNTIILVSSGITVTWAHHSLMENNLNQTIYSLMLTIILGIYFTALQSFEYMESMFTISDSVYGSTFFMATGFHGLHVIIGTLFLSFMMMRTWLNHFSSKHHFGFEAAAWYWHFVDVVCIIFMYFYLLMS
uniref:Cytochrome c oxidase subunit 3 n=1 Tax=Dictyoptera aurora TaxID=1053893 RepID=A0A0S2MN86_9COLE|nr:cytochrome c oxidase subunit 3 [Dictyoptera aurora]